MALDVTVGGATARSYATVAEAKARWDDIGFGYAALNLTDTQIEESLRRTAVWLDGYYLERWPGEPAASTQSLQWPRSSAIDYYGRTIDSTSIPEAVKFAQIEGAQREVQVVDSLTPDFVASKQVTEAGAGPTNVKFGNLSGNIGDLQPVLSSVEYHLRYILTRKVSAGVFVV